MTVLDLPDELYRNIKILFLGTPGNKYKLCMSSANPYIGLCFLAHSFVIYVTECCFIISLLSEYFVKSLDKQCYHWFKKAD